MEDKSVPVGSLVEQKEPPVSTDSPTEPNGPIGNKDVITSMALKRAVNARLGRDKGEVSRMWWVEDRGTSGRIPCAWARGIRCCVKNQRDVKEAGIAGWRLRAAA
jgi:hypothetical protein